MIRVYKVDNHTRLFLPDTEFTAQVITKLRELEYAVEQTDEEPEDVERDEAEMERMRCLLAETGL